LILNNKLENCPVSLEGSALCFMLQVLVALIASFLTFDSHGSELGKKKVEMRGIDPRTSRMLSERSTI
jgi:hypothetical protein